MRRNRIGLLALGLVHGAHLGLAAPRPVPSPRAAGAPEEVLALARRLFEQESSPRVRLAAARVLAPAGESDALEHLLWGLEKEHHQQGMFEDTLAGLAACPRPEASAALIAGISSGSTPRARAIIARVALQVAPTKALSEAEVILGNPEFSLDHRLAEAIAIPATQLGGPVALRVLRTAYAHFVDGTQSGPALGKALRILSPEAALATALAASRSRQWGDRVGAARDLGHLATEPATARLVQLLEQDEDHNVLRATAKALVAADPVAFAPVAARVAQRPEISLGLQRQLLLALAAQQYLGAVPIIQDALEADDFRIRATAVHAAGLIGQEEFLPQVFELMTSAPEVLVRSEAARGLSRDPTPAILVALTSALDSGEDLVAAAAASALGSHRTTESRDLLIARLSKDSPYLLRRVILDVLAGDLHPDAEQAIAAMIVPGVPEPLRTAALQALAKFPTPSRFPGVFRGLRDDSIEVQAAALVALSRNADWAEQASAQVVALLEGAPQPGLRLRAIAVLAQCPTPRVADALAARALSDPIATIRKTAVQVLTIADREIAWPTWITSLRTDSHRSVRRAAVTAFFSDPTRAFPELRRAALRDEDPFVRRLALVGLAAVGQPVSD